MYTYKHVLCVYICVYTYTYTVLLFSASMDLHSLTSVHFMNMVIKGDYIR